MGRAPWVGVRGPLCCDLGWPFLTGGMDWAYTRSSGLSRIVRGREP